MLTLSELIRLKDKAFIDGNYSLYQSYLKIISNRRKNNV